MRRRFEMNAFLVLLLLSKACLYRSKIQWCSKNLQISRGWDFEPKKLVSFVDTYVDHFWDDMANVYNMAYCMLHTVCRIRGLGDFRTLSGNSARLSPLSKHNLTSLIDESLWFGHEEWTNCTSCIIYHFQLKGAFTK